jgi:hypothetical protein
MGGLTPSPSRHDFFPGEPGVGDTLKQSDNIRSEEIALVIITGPRC